MARTPEGTLKDKVKKLLHARGFIRAGAIPGHWPTAPRGWYYMPSQNGRGVVGVPDFICCWDGRFLAIETKAPGGTPTPNQLQRLEEIKAAAGLGLICTDVSQVESLLDREALPTPRTNCDQIC